MRQMWRCTPKESAAARHPYQYVYPILRSRRRSYRSLPRWQQVTTVKLPDTTRYRVMAVAAGSVNQFKRRVDDHGALAADGASVTAALLELATAASSCPWCCRIKPSKGWTSTWPAPSTSKSTAGVRGIDGTCGGGVTLSQLITDFGRTMNLVFSSKPQERCCPKRECSGDHRRHRVGDGPGLYNALQAQALLKAAQR